MPLNHNHNNNPPCAQQDLGGTPFSSVNFAPIPTTVCQRVCQLSIHLLGEKFKPPTVKKGSHGNKKHQHIHQVFTCIAKRQNSHHVNIKSANIWTHMSGPSIISNSGDLQRIITLPSGQGGTPKKMSQKKRGRCNCVHVTFYIPSRTSSRLILYTRVTWYM